MAGLESSLFVMHNFVSKQEHWLAAGSDYLGLFGVGDYGVEDDPFFDDAEGEVFVVFPDYSDDFIKW